MAAGARVVLPRASLRLTGLKRGYVDDASKLTGADKLMRDALLSEEEEEAAMARKQRIQDPNDPVWTGEERVQDTVLRMVMDKYKPLRVKIADDGTHPADAKIQAGIQTPGRTQSGPDTAVVSLNGPKGEGEHEDGRRLPKTPDARPWRAVYVRPSHLLGSGAEDTPSVYYGQYLQSSASSSRLPTGTPSSDLRQKLKRAGVNAAALPLDNPKAMNQLRQGLKMAERRGKLLKARDSVIDYTLAKPQGSHHHDDGVGEKDPSADPNLQLQLGQARGWASVVEERIKAAQEAGLFKENKLRGKPITRDIEERNPFLGREEFFMNRIVKRQGAAPPWVELNMALESELASWKERMTDAWVRRASRMITTSPLLRAGMEPLPAQNLTAAAQPKETDSAPMPASQSAGQQKLVEVATRYRDMEWEDRERSYHKFEIKRLNDLIRNHNHLAPFTARKGLLMLDMELKAMYARSLPELIHRLSELLEQERNPRAPRLDTGLDANPYGLPTVTYDIWGREIKATDPVRAGGWLGRASTDGDKDGHTPNTDYEPNNDVHRRKRSRPQGQGLLVVLRKSVEWARERIGV